MFVVENEQGNDAFPAEESVEAMASEVKESSPGDNYDGNAKQNEKDDFVHISVRVLRVTRRLNQSDQVTSLGRHPVRILSFPFDVAANGICLSYGDRLSGGQLPEYNVQIVDCHP